MKLAAVLILVAAVLLGAVLLLEAQPLPHLKSGQCAAGWAQSGGFCVPMDERSQPAIPKPAGKQCPASWTPSGDACLKQRQP